MSLEKMQQQKEEMEKAINEMQQRAVKDKEAARLLLEELGRNVDAQEMEISRKTEPFSDEGVAKFWKRLRDLELSREALTTKIMELIDDQRIAESRAATEFGRIREGPTRNGVLRNRSGRPTVDSGGADRAPQF